MVGVSSFRFMHSVAWPCIFVLKTMKTTVLGDAATLSRKTAMPWHTDVSAGTTPAGCSRLSKDAVFWRLKAVHLMHKAIV